MKQLNTFSPSLVFPAFTRDGTMQTVAVPAGVDPAAKLVTVEITAAAFGGTVAVGIPGTSHPLITWNWALGVNGHATMTIPVVGGSVLLAASHVLLGFRVVAEWGGDAVVVPGGDMVAVPGWTVGNTGTYREEDVASFFGGDAGNVAAVLCFMDEGETIGSEPDTNFDKADARPTGATYSGWDPRVGPQRKSAWVSVADDNTIEVRESGKSPGKGDPLVQVDQVYLVAYILKGPFDDGSGDRFTYQGVDDPVEDGVGVGAWANFDVGPLTSPTVDAIYWRSMYRKISSGNLVNHYAREVGSVQTVRTQNQRQSVAEYPLAVDSNQEVQHYFSAPAGEGLSWIWGYLEAAAPDQATSPVPAHLATAVPIDQILGWTAGTGTASHDVYFGTDPTPDAGEFQGNQPGASFNPGTLQPDTTYYWRIDEVNAAGTTTGVVWSFTTAAPVCLAAEPSAFARVRAVTTSQRVVEAAPSQFARIAAMVTTPNRVGAAPSARRRITAAPSLCGEGENMKANATCPDELPWNATGVLDLDEVVDEIAGLSTPITSADLVTCSIFDADDDTELSTVSPVTLNQVGGTNHWRNTVDVTAANGFSRKQRLRLVYTFDGGASLLGEFETLGVVAASVN